MGKVHGSLARAGKVKGQTPKIDKQEKKKQPRGRSGQDRRAAGRPCHDSCTGVAELLVACCASHPSSYTMLTGNGKGLRFHVRFDSAVCL